jgi:hypothetical protein
MHQQGRQLLLHRRQCDVSVVAAQHSCLCEQYCIVCKHVKVTTSSNTSALLVLYNCTTAAHSQEDNFKLLQISLLTVSISTQAPEATLCMAPSYLLLFLHLLWWGCSLATRRSTSALLHLKTC